MSHQITKGKLPSNSQILRNLFCNIRQVKYDTREAIITNEVIIIWEKA